MKKLLLSLLTVSFGLTSLAQSDYTIEFLKEGKADGSAITANKTTIAEAVTPASADYVDGTFSQAERAYFNSKKGLKFGSSSGPGSATFTLSSNAQISASGLIINAASYSEADVNTSVKITINDSDEYETVQFTNAELTDYSVSFSSPVVISSIKLESLGTAKKKSRVFIGALTVIASDSDTPAKESPELSFSEATCTVTIGRPFTAPVLLNPNNLPVTYSTSDPTVATVDEHGAVQILAPGTATIKATSAETETFARGSASYTLYVNDVAENIAAFLNAANSGVNTTITGNVTVTYHNDKYLFVQDATGYLEIFGKLNRTYTNGSILCGITGKYSEYSNMPQMVPDLSTFLDATEGSPVAPAEVDPADVQVSQYVKLTDVEIIETEGKFYVSDIQLYDRFNIEGLEIRPSEKATVIGLGAIYNSIREIFVTDIIYPEDLLGDITITPDIEALGNEPCLTFPIGTTFTIDAEHADELFVDILDSEGTVVLSFSAKDIKWTPDLIGSYSVCVYASNGDDKKTLECQIAICAEPLNITYAGHNYMKVTSPLDMTDGDKYVIISEPFKSGAVQYGAYIMGGQKASKKGCYPIEISSSDTMLDGYDLSGISGYAELTLHHSNEYADAWTLSVTDDGNNVKYLGGEMIRYLGFYEKEQAFDIQFDLNNGNALIKWWENPDISLQFYAQNLNSYAANRSFNTYNTDQHHVYLYKLVDIEAPALLINGEPVDLDEPYNLNQQTVKITLSAPDNHHIYYKHVKTEAPDPVIALDDAAGDFTHVGNNSAEIEVSDDGTLHFYSEHQATGLKSETKTLTFEGGTTSISEIPADGSAAPAEIFDLQGRRVLTPSRRGIYLTPSRRKLLL